MRTIANSTYVAHEHRPTSSFHRSLKREKEVPSSWREAESAPSTPLALPPLPINMTLSTLMQTQLSTLRLFLTTPTTRTPTILLLIASFGSSLHHPVTTFFYLSVIGESAALSIGTLGFIQGLGGTIGGPIVGWALDKYGPWIPIVVTATACSMGCLWRGFAQSLTHLQMGAILNGVGVNLWTVVVAHLVKSFPPGKRSDVLSGVSVQLAVVQIGGKALFPFVEYTLKNVVGIDRDLIRYRLHMGVCTVFCFYGTVALFWDRSNIGKASRVSGTILKEKQSDVFDCLEGGVVQSNCGLEDSLPLVRHLGDASEPTAPNGDLEMVDTLRSNAIISHNRSDEDSSDLEQIHNQQKPLIDANHIAPNTRGNETKMCADYGALQTKKKQLITTTILSIALLLQSLSNTILTVLWPLLVHDRFNMTAQTFGVITFISSMTSMGSMAMFPLVERKAGRMRCAAVGLCIASLCGVLFCICSFGEQKYGSPKDQDRILANLDSDHFGDSMIGRSVYLKNQQGSYTDSSASVLTFFEDYSVSHEVDNSTMTGTINTNQRINKHIDNDAQAIPYLWHAISAIILQASLSFLEPSLKSILSIASSSHSTHEPSTKSSLGSIMGFMTTIANVGGMAGNIAGTWMYKFSKDLNPSHRFFFRDGSLPFFVSAILLGVTALFIWGLDEPFQNLASLESRELSHLNESNEPGIDNKLEKDSRDGCCLGLREREISDDVKCD